MQMKGVTPEQQLRRQKAAEYRKSSILKILEAAPTITKSCSFFTEMLGHSKWDSRQISFTRQALNSLITDGKVEKVQRHINGKITNFYKLSNDAIQAL